MHKPFIVNLNSGDIKKFPILDSGNSYSFHSGFVTLNKNESIGEHSTGIHEELIIVLEGEGEIDAEGEGRKKIQKGEAAYNPPETLHNVFNFNDAPLKYIYIVTKAK